MTDVDAQAAETNIGDLRQQSDLKYQSRSGLRYFLRRFAGETPLNVLALGIITVFIFLSILSLIHISEPTRPY